MLFQPSCQCRQFADRHGARHTDHMAATRCLAQINQVDASCLAQLKQDVLWQGIRISQLEGDLVIARLLQSVQGAAANTGLLGNDRNHFCPQNLGQEPQPGEDLVCFRRADRVRQLQYLGVDARGACQDQVGSRCLGQLFGRGLLARLELQFDGVNGLGGRGALSPIILRRGKEGRAV